MDASTNIKLWKINWPIFIHFINPVICEILQILITFNGKVTKFSYSGNERQSGNLVALYST